MTRWIRERPEPKHDALAGLVATAAGMLVGAGVFYLTRLLVARERLPEAGGQPRTARSDGAAAGPGAGDRAT